METKSLRPVPSTALTAPTEKKVAAQQIAAPKEDLVSVARVDRAPRAAINRVITAVNVADGVTKEIRSLVDSLAGIVAQVEQDPPPTRAKKLESEARELVSAIKSAASTEVDGSKVLAGDPVSAQVESLGRALEFILPDNAARGFDIPEPTFSRKEVIVNVRRSVEEARREIESIQAKIDAGRADAARVLTELEVASENREASQSSVRDLDGALSLASQAGRQIALNPEQAQAASTNIAVAAVRLLAS